MIIIIDCKNLAIYSSGISGYFKPLLKSILEYFKNYKFILVAPNKFDTSFIKEFDNWELKIISKRKIGNDTLNNLLYDTWVYPNALKKIEANFLISPYYDFIIPKKYKNRSIITVHDLCYWELKESYSFKVRFYHQLLLNLNLSKARKVITVSKASLEKIKNIFGQETYDKSVVIYNTFQFHKSEDLNTFENTKNMTKTLLYTGGFEQRKNIDMLFSVLKDLKSEIDLKLIFTGNFKRSERLKKMIHENELQNIVFLTGMVSAEELNKFYKECDSVINISLCEGFGRSNLEAVMHDKPLVCSDIKVFHELVGDYAIYCNPFDKNSIKKAIKKSFNQNNDRMFKLEASRFDFERNKGAFIRTIEEVLNEQ
jgi:glycosyltransferase involved in cell wall biosynthesis